MIKARFTPVQKVPAYFSIGARQLKSFIITQDGADLASVSGWTWELCIKKNSGAQKKTISLTLGNGLSYEAYTSYTLVADFSASQTSIEEGEYFWQLTRTDISQIWISGKAYFSFEAPDVEGDSSLTIDIVSETLTVNLKSGEVAAASQTEVNAMTNATKYVSPKTLSEKDADVVALTSGASIALTNEKHSLATALTAITFTNSFIGDVIVIEITLTGTALTLTFPSGYLCQSQGTASGDKTCGLSGTSGDKYIVCVIKMGSNYYVSANNLGQ